MRITKKLAIDDEISRNASLIFNEAVAGFPLPLRFDCIEFHIRDSTLAYSAGREALICVDYENFFLQEMDEKGIRALLLRQLFKAASGTEDVDKDMIKNGYYDDVFYLYCNYIMRTDGSQASALLGKALGIFRNRDDAGFIRSAMQGRDGCR